MGFWIFMLIMNLLIPLIMLLLGRRFITRAPGEINYIFGYRTEMSMKNQDTWQFAHTLIGKIWFYTGIILLPIVIVLMLLLLGKDKDTIGNFGGIICAAELIPLIVSIIPVEITLRKHFDSDGNKKK